jgi:hypothetical protein
MSDTEIAHCPDCQVSPSEAHDDGCDVARCTECGHQRISCHHDDGDTGWGQIWTGTWPGVADATRLGWWALFEPGKGWQRCSATTPGAVPNLNRLALEACWNRETQAWELVTA